jgi:hypothetical protein
VIRERAQLAMSNMPSLAITTRTVVLPSLINPYHPSAGHGLVALESPGGSRGPGSGLRPRFKLHIDVTRAPLGARSHGRRAQRADAIAKTKAGPSKVSERRRLLALLYGGDPMAPGGSFAEHHGSSNPTTSSGSALRMPSVQPNTRRGTGAGFQDARRPS